jgi:hypothetical protein
VGCVLTQDKYYRGGELLSAGFIPCLTGKEQDRVDPMSSDADENIDDELRKDEMREQAKKEKDNHPEL